MTIDDLRAGCGERWGDGVFVEARQQGAKTVVECGVVIPATACTKRWKKSIVFNAASIPENALAKIEMAIR